MSIPQPVTSKQPTQEDIDFFCEAAFYGECAKMAELLAEFGGAIVNARDKTGDTAFSWAVWLGFEDMFDLLLRNGADIDLAESTGRTPLHCAIQSNYPHLVRRLLDLGADAGTPDADGLTPLQVAEKFKRKDIVAILGAHAAGQQRLKEEAVHREETARQNRLESLQQAAPRAAPFKKNKQPRP